ncbi:MAG: DUF1501 domain-containing protein [Akkermansiaceae bacterium]
MFLKHGSKRHPNRTTFGFWGLKKNRKDVDQACVDLIKNLQQRGVPEDTLVIFGGESNVQRGH